MISMKVNECIIYDSMDTRGDGSTITLSVDKATNKICIEFECNDNSGLGGSGCIITLDKLIIKIVFYLLSLCKDDNIIEYIAHNHCLNNIIFDSELKKNINSLY